MSPAHNVDLLGHKVVSVFTHIGLDHDRDHHKQLTGSTRKTHK